MRWLLVLLLLAAPVGAQGYTLTLQEMPSEQVAPDAPPLQVSVPWQIACNPTTATIAHLGTLQWDPVLATAPGVIVSGNMTEQLQLPQCPGPARSGVSVFDLEVTQDAPGLEPILLTWIATLHYGVLGPDTGTSTAKGTSIVTPDYLGVFAVDAERTIFNVPGGSAAKLQLAIENLGNRAADFQFYLDGESVHDGVQIARDATAEITIPLNAPSRWFGTEEILYSIDVVNSAADHPDVAGDTRTVNTLVRAQASPIPTIAIVVLALVAVAFIVLKVRK